MKTDRKGDRHKRRQNKTINGLRVRQKDRKTEVE